MKATSFAFSESCGSHCLQGSFLLCRAIVLALLGLVGSTVGGQGQVTWTNAAGGNWNDPANWDTGVPGDGAIVNLTSSLGAAYPVAYTNAMAASNVYSVTMNGATAAEAVTLTIVAGGFNVEDRLSIGTNSTVVLQPGASVTLGTLEGRRGTLTMNGGTLTCLTAFTHGTGGKPGAPFNARIYDGVFTTPATTLGSSENGGTLIISGGQIDLGTYSAGRDSGSTANAFTTGLIVSNGNVRVSGITLSTGNSAASMRVAGGSVTNTGSFIIGNSSTGTARETGYRQTGGVLDTTAANENIILGNTANSQRAWLDVRGGLLNAYGVTLVSDPGSSGVNATFNVSDTGMVYLGAGGVLNNATTYTISLGNGGLLGATAAWALAGDLTLSGGVGTLQAGNAEHAPFDLVITGGLKGAGTLAKTGLGKLSVQGVSTHTGEIQIREGIFALEGSASVPTSASIVVADKARFDAGSTFTLNGGQSLAGQGTVSSNVKAVSGASIRPAGNGSSGQLILENNLTLDGGVTGTFDIESASSKDLLVVGGALTLNGTNTILITSTLGSGTYRLIDYGTLVGDVSTLQVVGVSGYLTNNTAGKGIDLVLRSIGRDPASLVWTGDGTRNAWDIGISTNWLNQGAKDRFFANDTVAFTDAGSRTPAVELVGDITPFSIVVDATGAYTFGGSGRIVGTTGLTKTNTGTLIINTINDFTGSTRILGGTLSVGSIANAGVPSGLGSARSEAANLILDGGTLEYTGASSSTDKGATVGSSGGGIAVADAGAILDWAGLVTGAGTLRKSGPGSLSLTHAANDYSGGTIVTGGTLLFGNLGSGSVTLNGGTFATTADQQNLTNTLVITGTGNHYQNSKNNTIAGVNGDGTLEIDFTAATDTITLGGDMTGFTGRIVVAGNSGNLRFYGFGNPGSAAASFDLGSSGAIVLTRNGNTTVRLGSVVGAPSTRLTGASSVTGALTTYEIGGNNASTTFEGVIEDNARPAPVALTKVGTGTLSLSAHNPYTGVTRVQAGTLALTDGADINASSRYEVLSGAVLDLSGLADPTLVLAATDQALAGDGTVKGNVSAGAGTLVAPGNPVGTLTITGNATLDGTTVMELNRGLVPNSDRIAAAHVTAQTGVLVVTNVGPRLVAGDRFQLFSGGISGGFATVNLPASDISGATYTWENSLATDGSIRVVTATGGVATTPTNLVLSVGAARNVTLSWPAEYIGWSLEVQTNAAAVGLSTNWVKVIGSSTTNRYDVSVDSNRGAVFFRMALP